MVWLHEISVIVRDVWPGYTTYGKMEHYLRAVDNYMIIPEMSLSILQKPNDCMMPEPMRRSTWLITPTRSMG